ncbi:SPFH domain-containing protein [Thalassomonas viridans]|uniref:SPFH domain-containing protein n=1 Tax=Thalassomonas viridans TaxID=137584 RepID=A0AAF0CB42_9GAMM|nr:SPFH domain-containing protein [Thalassomonas viridans]WDE07558.1 SPFH domain-containing protein [Thalassomonas viridans]
MIQDRTSFSKNGYLMLVVLLALTAFDFALLTQAKGLFFGVILIGAVILALCFVGFYMVQPNQGKVMTLFGAYAGTDKTPGLRWTIPFYLRKSISLRVRNFESGRLKVNDKAGNPIEIATVVVWSVQDTAEALFEVDDYESFVTIQSEAALRTLATCYPYDQYQEDEVALRSHGQQIAASLREEIQARLKKAGIQVHEARISHLAYAPEIANAMLQRQQAAAIIAARSKIVDGAVGMVEMALDKLTEQGVVELDEERKAAMVSNLLVVLCGDKNAQPVINSGSLY